MQIPLTQLFTQKSQFAQKSRPDKTVVLVAKGIYTLRVCPRPEVGGGQRMHIRPQGGGAHLAFAHHHPAALLRGDDGELAWGRGLQLLLLVAKGAKGTNNLRGPRGQLTFGGEGLRGRITHRPCRNLWCPWPWAMGGVQHHLVQPTVASGRSRSQALEMPFLATNPLLRAPRNCTTACDPSTHIFSCALCHESSFHHIFILTEKKRFSTPK